MLMTYWRGFIKWGQSNPWTKHTLFFFFPCQKFEMQIWFAASFFYWSEEPVSLMIQGVKKVKIDWNANSLQWRAKKIFKEMCASSRCVIWPCIHTPANFSPHITQITICWPLSWIYRWLPWSSLCSCHHFMHDLSMCRLMGVEFIFQYSTKQFIKTQSYQNSSFSQTMYNFTAVHDSLTNDAWIFM